MRVKVPGKWDMENDVVVVGWGGAGSIAAVTAHDAGASVLILEKMAKGGGNTAVSSANILIPKGREIINYLDALNFGNTDREMVEIFVDHAMKLPDWFKEMGSELQPYVPLDVFYPSGAIGRAGFPKIPGAEAVAKYNIKGTLEEGKSSQRLWKFYSDLVAKRGIKVLTSTPAKELIANLDGEIVGVMAERDGKAVNIKARKAVILTCGGFENDPKLKSQYLPVKPILFLGTPGNTGDGIRMVQKVGGDLWHMTVNSCAQGFQAPGFEAAMLVQFLDAGFIFVDKHGRRVVNEGGQEAHDQHKHFDHFDSEKMEFPIPLWTVFDEQTRRKSPLYRGFSAYNRDLYAWSRDNSAEIANGWILQGKTVAELAANMSIHPQTFEETIKRYNVHCKAGKDVDFGRAKEDLRVLEPPFYAIQLWPALINTQGGPRHDKNSRVLDLDGRPIPRLYVAGELGSMWGYRYQGGSNMAECLVFGRIAGKNAAAEKPWS